MPGPVEKAAAAERARSASPAPAYAARSGHCHAWYRRRATLGSLPCASARWRLISGVSA